MKMAVTGHRPQRLKGKQDYVKAEIDKVLLREQPDLAITGMAQGVDQIFGLLAKERGIPLLCVYPFEKKRYSSIEEYLMAGNDTIFMHSAYTNKGMYIERDREMVDRCDKLLAVWDGIEAGGTWQTIKYARECGKEIEYINV